MTQTSPNQDLLEQLRQSARAMSRQDKSKTYLQWLDVLCAEHGFTYTSLKKRVEEIEAQALAESLAAEDRIWDSRLTASRVWGDVPKDSDQSIALPVKDDGNVPWPAGFIESRLFTLAEAGVRSSLSGPVFRMDGHEMLYDGEELRLVSDQTLLMAFILLSRGVKCGDVVVCSLPDLERAFGGALPTLGLPIAEKEIERTLWRLSNCRLTFDEYGFDGAILAYADARHAPERFGFAFAPAFINFFYPFMQFLRSQDAPASQA